ncbi:hypothetical protein BZA05DRAFT_393668 [Tricharina praecox]|uniref:uncharacterized protein n=1 Tax=Tricharina praecox TaxID=43433 RepID=UPI0022210F5A|nr:uncharacterized protein BZA05DRAFT_393668 [Tricharina praecox]KAI5854252.1 hypothetical protein BZA05DRAFT_393668 [Tricharina praecox]
MGSDLELTLSRAPGVDVPLSGKKKGASVQQRRIRVLTHCLHVQYLLFHGWARNRWVSDAEVQAVLLSQLPAGISAAFERVREKAGGKGKTDPLLTPLGMLLHWWRAKFTVDAPALRKRGYRSLRQFVDEREAAGEDVLAVPTGRKDAEGREVETMVRREGETVKGLQAFRTLARECKGSRDVGALLLTGICRALGFEARVVFSLQPLGFGFSTAETAEVVTTGDKPAEVNGKVNGKAKVNGKGHGKRKRVDSDEDDESSGLSSLEDTSDDDDSGKSSKFNKPAFDRDLLYPTFWTELHSPYSNTYLTLSAFPSPLLGHTPDLTAKFEPRGKKAANAKQVIAYVVAYSSDGHARDVTARYLSKRTFPGKTKGFRIPVSQVPIYSYDGKVVSSYSVDWFAKALLPLVKPREKWTDAEVAEDEDLRKAVAPPDELAAKKYNTNTLSGLKNHPELVLERHLKREEAIIPGKGHARTFTSGKGDKKLEEKVYNRADVAVCKAVENWYREGRTVKVGEQPLKMVKRRAVTLARKREIEEKQREGETAMQGLYAEFQTELYIPPPIEDGFIPTNAFGNIDVYVPTMVPAGAVHIPLKGAGRVAKKLGVSYAEAVTGFEFRQQRALPYIEGVVVAQENEGLVRDAWRAAEEERKKREDGKREAEALGRWRRLVLKARVLKRLREEYGETHPGENQEVEVNPFVRKDSQRREPVQDGGGVVPTDEDEDEDEDEGEGYGGGGFLLDDDEEGEQPPPPPVDGDGGGGGFILDIEEEEKPTPQFLSIRNGATAMSLRDMADMAATDAESSSLSSDEGEAEEEEDEDEDDKTRSKYFSPQKAAVKKAPIPKKTPAAARKRATTTKTTKTPRETTKRITKKPAKTPAKKPAKKSKPTSGQNEDMDMDMDMDDGSDEDAPVAVPVPDAPTTTGRPRRKAAVVARRQSRRMMKSRYFDGGSEEEEEEEDG